MAGVKYAIQERTFLLRPYYELNYDIKLLREKFEQEFLNRGSSTSHTIYNTDQKFKCTCSFGDASHSGYPRDARTKKMCTLLHKLLYKSQHGLLDVVHRN